MPEIYADSIEAKVDGTNQIVPIRDITKAPAIIASASGEFIELSDSGDAPLTDMKLYGKSKQVTTTGAQLFDSKKTVLGRYDLSGTFQQSSVWYYFEFNASDIEYTLSGLASVGDRTDASIVGIDSSGGIHVISSVNNKSFETDGYDKIGFSVINKDLSSVMLNKGSSALPWEPYTGGQPAPSPEYQQPINIPGEDGNITLTVSSGSDIQQTILISTPNGLPGIPVTSGGNYTDADGQQWISDIKDYGTRIYTQKCAIITFDGSEDEKWTVSSTLNYRYVTNLAMSIPASMFLCNRFKAIVTEGASSENGCAFIDGNKNLQIVMEPYVNDISGFKLWLSENPVTIVYQVLEPIKIDITAEEIESYNALMTSYPSTNITTDTEPQVGMEVEYSVDTKMYIDNKMNEIQTQLLNMKTQEV